MLFTITNRQFSLYTYLPSLVEEEDKEKEEEEEEEFLKQIKMGSGNFFINSVER